jgi:hypothetical protein
MEKQHLGLKFLVIFMGILIIVGIGVIAYTIISRLAAGGKATQAPTQVVEQIKAPATPVRKWQPRPLKPFGDVSAKIPAGSVIEDMETGRRRLILRLRLASGQQALHIFNLTTGERLGVISLQAE